MSRRSPIDWLLESVQWMPVDWEAKGGAPDGGLPYATHSGVLRIGDIEMECAQLNTGQRVITEAGLEAFFGKGWREETERLP